MPVEMIGWISPRISSEIIPPAGPPFDAEVIAKTARIHEAAGFDRVLIGYFSTAPDGFLVGAHAAAVTDRLQFLLAHRPGFVAPTVAARKLATLDQLTGGRTAVHIISGGSAVEQARDGDFADHAARYRRTHEYVSLLKRVWTAAQPFDHQGEFYHRRRRLRRHPLPADAAPPHLRRRRLAGRSQRPRAARRRLHAMGRASRRHTTFLWKTFVKWPLKQVIDSPSASQLAPSWGAPKARRGTAPETSWPR